MAEQLSLECYSTKELARMLKVSQTTVQRWVRNEGLPMFKAGNKLYRIKRVDFENWYRKRKEQQL